MGAELVEKDPAEKDPAEKDPAEKDPAAEQDQAIKELFEQAKKSKEKPAAPMLTMLKCCILPLVISATFMGLYWSLFSDAVKYNAETK